MAARRMINRITPAASRPAFEAKKLRSEALVIKKINAPRIQQRQQRAIKFRLALIARQIVDAMLAKLLTRRFAGVPTIGFQQRRVFGYKAFRRKWRLHFSDAIKEPRHPLHSENIREPDLKQAARDVRGRDDRTNGRGGRK